MPYQAQDQELGVMLMFSDDVLKRLQKRDRENLFRFAEMERDAAAVRFTNYSIDNGNAENFHLLNQKIEETLSENEPGASEGDVFVNDGSTSNFALATAITESFRLSIPDPAQKPDLQASDTPYRVLYKPRDGVYRSCKGTNLLTCWSLERFMHFLSKTIADLGMTMVFDDAQDPISCAVKVAIKQLINESIISLSQEMTSIIDVIKSLSKGQKLYVRREDVLQHTGLDEETFSEALDYLMMIDTVRVHTDENGVDLLALHEAVVEFI